MEASRRNIPVLYMVALFVLSANGLAHEGRCYNIVNNMAMVGHNEKVIRWKSFDECKELCDEEMSFVCLSFDYTPSGTCYLSRANHRTAPESYGSHHGSIYGYATECSQSEDEISNKAFDSVIQNDATEYDNEEGEELHHDGRCYEYFYDKHLYVYSQNRVSASSLQECLRNCDLETSFICLSVNYLPPGICELMPITREDEPELFGVFDDAVYAAVTECQSDSSRRVRYIGSSEESDESSEYEYVSD